MTEHFTYRGNHRIWHVLVTEDGAGGASVRRKFSEPREGVLWFDRRCFAAEEQLLQELPGLGVTRVPAVRAADGTPDGLLLQDFVEGRTLAQLHPHGTPVPPEHLEQILARFAELAAVRPGAVRTPRRCRARERAGDRDTAAFLRTLLSFTRESGFLAHRARHGALFDALGVPAAALDPRSWLHREAGALTPRPFCLLHGDLHRANFVVDARGALWTIDWELAMVGDPLYDLATHLHLMRYPAGQRDEVVARWGRTVARVLPGADRGLAADLPRYLAYKRAQSALTDVVRHAQKTAAASPAERPDVLETTARTVHGLLRAAAPVLGMRAVPHRQRVRAAFARAAGRPGAPGQDTPRPAPAAPAGAAERAAAVPAAAGLPR
jgi:aminoglycoside phosphotransferase (APT) family kinase protein